MQYLNILQMSHFDNLDGKIKCKTDFLLNQLSVESPIRPLKGFKLDFSTILGLFGLMTTYSIVLIQFKIEEINN